MNKKTLVAVAAVVLLVAVAFSAGCTRVPLTESQKLFGGEPGKSSTESTSAPLGGAERIDATIRMGVGDLAVSSVSSQTAGFTGDFKYNPSSWKPEVTYGVGELADGVRVGVLYVGQPEAGGATKWLDAENAWDLALAGGVPMNLSLKMGVGEGSIDLRSVDVRYLEAVTGVGQTEIDLSGPRSSDVSGTITTGVGETTVRLPRDVGVQITGGGDGLGNVSSEGFNGSGNVKTNDAWNQPGPKITLKVVRGVGDITFELVE
jgi:hypothetical protein